MEYEKKEKKNKVTQRYDSKPGRKSARASSRIVRRERKGRAMGREGIYRVTARPPAALSALGTIKRSGLYTLEFLGVIKRNDHNVLQYMEFKGADRTDNAMISYPASLVYLHVTWSSPVIGYKLLRYLPTVVPQTPKICLRLYGGRTTQHALQLPSYPSPN